jgi:acetylornithine deacetylase/succinyl-diaminopimelate desuccinylase-like protein
MRLRLAALFVLIASGAGVQAQGKSARTRNDEVKQWIKANQPAVMQEFVQLASIPDVKSDKPNIARNAEFLKAMLTRHGFAVQVWTTPGSPMVYGEHKVAGATRTLLFYIHYDGQPVQPKEWDQPDPFVPVLRDESLDHGGKVVPEIAGLTSFPPQWRLYGRATADDKGPIEALCSAMDAIRQSPTSNIRVILDGEEEGGGPALGSILKNHAPELQADLMVLLDGPQHASARHTIYFGARGGAGLEMTVYTAKMSMHSGNYGNWMPDANVRLAQLIASMVAPSGRVTMKDFYADVPPFSPQVKAMFAAVPDESAAMQRAFGIGRPDGAASSLQEGLNLPTFSVHTMQGGEAGGVIPGKASAQIAMRLVIENKPNVMIERAIEHIKSQGYFVVDHDPDVETLAAHDRVVKITSRAVNQQGGGAWRTDPAIPQAVFVKDALHGVWGDKVVEIRTAGGGVPAGPFIETNHVPVIGVALVNYDDNQHTNNENLRLGNLWDGIQTLAALLDSK